MIPGGMRIAVLAPDPTVRGQVVSALLSAGHTVVEPEAAARPSVALLLDPVDASIEWSLARGAELHARLPLMVLTGRSERAAIERLLRVADDVLPWPVALDILGDHLSRLARNGERPGAPADGAIGAITFTAPDPSGNHEGERLRRSEGLLAQAAHLAHLGCWIFDPGRQHLDASDELCQLFGVARADLPGTASGLLSSILHPEDRCAVDAAIAGAARQPHRVELQLRVVRPDGAVRHCQVVADLEPGVVPTEARWLGTVQDVTERVEAVRALQSGEAQLRR
ncbi:MAG TPA: PAS domain S-box protein, partial [Kofleriaceae bacterium]|nr:PAS domain S-box protein [Kofleriaceae bacterium]